MEPPASKRQRTASTSSQSSAPVIVQSSVWYPDGNIILQTGKGTSDAPFTRFRVYKGILAEKSSVFKDMLLVAGEGDGDELVDGCPLVQLDDDKEELEHVLRALHMDPAYYDSEGISFSALAGFIRLGRKYDISHLHSRGLARILFEHPSSLEGYMNDGNWTKIHYYPTICFDILGLCVECDIRPALPLAYFKFTTIPAQDFLDSNLHRALVATIMKGKEKLMAQQWRYYMSWAEPTHASGVCENHLECAEAKMTIVADAYKNFMFEVADFPGWDEKGDVGWKLSLCDVCAETGERHYNEGMKQLWKDLPSFFDLPPWDVLLKDQDS